MAANIKVRKGGKSRVAITEVAQNDSFVLPRGYKISGFISEADAVVTTPHITVGTTPGIYPVQTFTVTAGCSATNDMTVDGVTVGLNQVTQATPAAVAAKIAATSLITGSGAPWVATAVGAVVTLTSNVPKASVSGITVAAGSTGATFSAVAVSQAGVRDVVTMASQNLPTAAKAIVDLTSNIQSGKNFNSSLSVTKMTWTPSISSGVAGTMYVCGVPVVCTAGNVATVAALCTKIASTKINGYTFTDGTTTFSIAVTTPGIGTPNPTFSLGSVGGFTLTKAVDTVEHVTSYINVDPIDAVGHMNFFILMEKMY